MTNQSNHISTNSFIPLKMSIDAHPISSSLRLIKAKRHCSRLLALILTLAANTAFADDFQVSTVDAIVRSVCMNQSMNTAERVSALEALGWTQSGDIKDAVGLARLEARNYLLRNPDDSKTLDDYAKSFMKALMARLGLHDLQDEKGSQAVLLGDTDDPSIKVLLYGDYASDRQVYTCQIALSDPNADMDTFLDGLFPLAPKSVSDIGESQRQLLFLYGPQKNYEWSLDLVSGVSDQETGEQKETLLSIITRVITRN